MDNGSIYASRQRLLTKASITLMGICTGIAADGNINDAEILFLRTWLLDNREALEEWPGQALAEQVASILADGKITEDERKELLETLEGITGNSFHETGSAAADHPALPLDQDPTIQFEDRTFCFTGTFSYGRRDACESLTESYGGVISDTVTKALDYLVIGSLISPAWFNQSYGRKIEKAASYRNKGGRPSIISEAQWRAAMADANP